MSSGIGLIRNDELRRALASWPSDLGDALEKQEWQREFVINTTRSFLLGTRVPLQRVASYQPQWVGSPLYALPEEAKSWVTPMRNSIEFRNVVSYRLHFANLATVFFLRLMDAEDRLLHLIQAGQ